MSPTPKLLSLLALLSLCFKPQVTFAAQERGGGEVIDIDGNPVLRDLVDNTVCRWKELRSLIQEIPEDRFTTLLNVLEEHNWYFSNQVKNEISQLKVCLTQGNLRKINTNDFNAVIVYVDNQGQQVAIRLNKEIYLDEKLYSIMTPSIKAYLVLHEIMHSFIPFVTSLRNQRVRSVIASISKLESGELAPEDLPLQLKQNSVQTVSNPADIADIKEDFKLLFDSDSDTELTQIEKEIIAARIISKQSRDYLIGEDRTKLFEIGYAFSEFLKLSPQKKLSSVINRSKQDRADWAGIALSQGANPNGRIENNRYRLQADHINDPATSPVAIMASVEAKPNILSQLIFDGADINIHANLESVLNEDDDTPLSASIRSSCHDCTHILLNSKNIKIEERVTGKTPLLVAVEVRNFEAVKLLLEAGANPHLESIDVYIQKRLLFSNAGFKNDGRLRMFRGENDHPTHHYILRYQDDRGNWDMKLIRLGTERIEGPTTPYRLAKILGYDEILQLFTPPPKPRRIK